jgi:adenylate cyclase
MTSSGTVTLLFTDLVNSTELLSRTGDESAHRIFDAHHKLLSEAVVAGGGHEVKWLGDGLMVAFPSAADAVRCAIAMQQSAQRAAGERLSLRVGLHVGEALKKESDYFGTAVVVARRLCESARAGQILCSSLVAGLLAGRQAFDFRDLGALRLKGLNAPVAACEVLYQHGDSSAPVQSTPSVRSSGERTNRRRRRALIAGVSALLAAALVYGVASRRSYAPSIAEQPAEKRVIRSIAVLPLENLSGDPSQEYFADGMTDELITDLATISALRVISRTSVMQFKGEHRKPLPEIARALDVDAVVEGSVLRIGNRVRITAQLIDAPADKHLWAKSYERDSRDVLALQDEIASSIAREVNVQLTPPEQTRLANAHAVNPEAHEAVLEGFFYLNKRTEDGQKRALDYFSQAIKADPKFGLAYSGLAVTYSLSAGLISNFFPPNEAMPKAREAAEKALALDDTLGEAHGALAVVKFAYDFDWPGAETEFQRRITLNPNDAIAHSGYGFFLTLQKRFDEAEAEYKRALELDPLNLVVMLDAALPFSFTGQYERAMAQYRKVLDMDPNFDFAHFNWGLMEVQSGRPAEGIVEMQKAQGLRTWPVLTAMLGYAYAVSGQRAEANELIAELARERYTSPACTADIYLGLGDRDRALEWLWKAYEDRSSALVWLKVDPIYDPVRSEPRFIELLKKVGLDK